MNRQIKFRAWDKEFKKFSKNALKYPIEDINYLTDYEWSQYTGLKDKNGKEIYEGDIVYFTVFDSFDNDTQHKGNVIWSTGDAEFGILSEEGIYYSLGWTINQDDEFEVIGNKFENPDLL